MPREYNRCKGRVFGNPNATRIRLPAASRVTARCLDFRLQCFRVFRGFHIPYFSRMMNDSTRFRVLTGLRRPISTLRGLPRTGCNEFPPARESLRSGPSDQLDRRPLACWRPEAVAPSGLCPLPESSERNRTAAGPRAACGHSRVACGRAPSESRAADLGDRLWQGPELIAGLSVQWALP